MVRKRRSNFNLRFYAILPKYQPRSGFILIKPLLFKSYTDAYAYMQLNDLSFDKFSIDALLVCQYEVVPQKLIEFE